MSKKTLTWLLKLVLLVCGCAILVAAGNLLPMYMAHVSAVRPELAGWYGWIIAFGWVLAIPGLLSLGLMWRVFHSLAAGEPFSAQNAKRFEWIWKLAAFDLALVAGMGLFLWVNHITPYFLVVTILGLMFLGVAAGVTCFALSGLVKSAARLREENEMTI